MQIQLDGVKRRLYRLYNPQVYWEIEHNVAPFKTVTNWWENVVKGTNVDLYIGHITE